MKKILRKLALLMAMVMLLTACGKSDGATSSDEGTRIFTDSLGREVEIPNNIERIAASGNLAQITVFALAPDKLVSLALDWVDGSEKYIDEKYMNLPMLGQLYGKSEMNVEDLLKVDPQIIIDVGEIKESSAEDMDALMAQVNIPTIFIEAHLETMDETYTMLGDLLGMADEAKEIGDYCTKVYTMCSDIMQTVEKAKLLYILGEDGLNVIANGAYHGELIDFLSDNLGVVEEISGKGTGNPVSMEQILMWNPDFIVFAPETVVYSTAASDPLWQQLDAIKNGNYIKVPEGPYNWMGFPPSVNRLLGMMWLCDALYPDAVTYDLKTEVQEYYKLFYHCDLTDEMYNELVNPQ